jgi:hypothetical protein
MCPQNKKNVEEPLTTEKYREALGLKNYWAQRKPPHLMVHP